MHTSANSVFGMAIRLPLVLLDALLVQYAGTDHFFVLVFLVAVHFSEPKREIVSMMVHILAAAHITRINTMVSIDFFLMLVQTMP